MTIKKYKVIWTQAINVLQIRREIGDVFEADSDDNEIKKLVKHKYLEEVK